jgi:pentatricopeptide repeat domain-containing protein 1
VWELLREMRTRGVKPGLITYNIMLNACAVEPDGAELAVDVWRDFKASGLWPDRILYLSLMRAMAPWTVERETVFALLDDAEGGKIPLDTQMANYALRLLAGSRELAGVEAMLQRMRDKDVARDVVSWTTAIKACQEAGDWAMALEFLAHMEEDGVEPNEITYATAIHVLGQAGRWEEAVRLLDAMEAKGMKNVVAFTSAMAACETAKAYPEGLRIWERMLEAKVKVTMPAIDVVLKICERAGEEEMAARVLEKSMDWGLLGRRSHVRKVSHQGPGAVPVVWRQPASVYLLTWVSRCDLSRGEGDSA